MPEFKRLRSIMHRWGGGTSAFFAFTHASHDMCPALLAPLLPLIRTSLGLSYLQSGILLSAYTVTSGFSQLLGGWLGDRLGQRTAIVIGIGGVGLATMAVGFSSAYYPLIAILVILGIFAGAYHPSAVPALYSHYEAERRGKALGLHMVGGSVGFALGPILGGFIAESLHWHFAFIILSIPALIAAPLVLKNIALRKAATKTGDSTTGSKEPSVETQEKRIGVIQALRPIMTITILAVLTQFVAGIAMAFMPIYLVDKHSVAPESAAVLLGVMRGGGIAGSLLGGWLSDRWDGQRATVFSLVVAGPILHLLTILPFNAFFIFSLIIFGLFAFMRQATIQPLLMDVTPPYLRATVFGLYFGMSMEGVSLLQPVAGHYMDIYGVAEVFHFTALTSVALSVVTLILSRLHRSGKQI